MACGEVHKVRLSEAEKDALVERIDAAAAYLGAEKPPKLVLPNADGAWDVGCTLEGEPDRLSNALSCICLGIDMPS